LYQRTALALNVLFGIKVGVGVLSYSLMALCFGTSVEMDAFWVAATPTLVTVNLIEAAGIGAAVNYYASLRSEPEARCRSEIVGFVVASFAVCVVVAGGVWLLASEVVELLAPGLQSTARTQAVQLLRVASVALAFGPATFLCLGLLQGAGRFFSASLITLLPAAVLVAGQLLAVSRVEQLAMFFLAGYVVAAIVAVARAWSVFGLRRERPTFGRLADLARQFVPLALGAMMIQAIWLRERSLASTLEPGVISAMSYALRVVTVLGGIVAAGFEATVMTAVAAKHVQKDHVGVRRHVRRVLLLVAVLALPPGCLLIVASDDIVNLLFRRGAFGVEAAQLTAAAVVGYLGVYVYASLGRVLLPATIGRRRALTALVVSFVTLASYVLWAPALATRLHISGLALAASLSFAVATLLYATDVARPV
jgi:putative peptidoglycan lipid II flippase